jgi:hypothetical protein
MQTGSTRKFRPGQPWPLLSRANLPRVDRPCEASTPTMCVSSRTGGRSGGPPTGKTLIRRAKVSVPDLVGAFPDRKSTCSRPWAILSALMCRQVIDELDDQLGKMIVTRQQSGSGLAADSANRSGACHGRYPIITFFFGPDSAANNNRCTGGEDHRCAIQRTVNAAPRSCD